ncbi:MAG: PTS sugar transporter subunit IIA [Planctomycetota bacterium]|nr:MAG: PTS sugar transporter subunit IIA [Planctomycetota bacterium]
MKLASIIPKRNLILDLKSREKKEVVTELVEQLVAAKALPKARKADVVARVMMREKQGSTGIQNGLAIPHVKDYPHIKKLVGVFGRSQQGVDFKSNDGKPANLFFLLVGPKDANENHLAALRSIAKMGQDQSFCGFIIDAETESDIVDLLNEADERFGG